VISAQMREMATHVAAMQQSVSVMDRATQNLGGSVTAMDASKGEKEVRFHGLNRSVRSMGRDVDQMARPLP
jgi:hypothetical protein